MEPAVMEPAVMEPAVMEPAVMEPAVMDPPSWWDGVYHLSGCLHPDAPLQRVVAADDVIDQVERASNSLSPTVSTAPENLVYGRTDGLLVGYSHWATNGYEAHQVPLPGQLEL